RKSVLFLFIWGRVVSSAIMRRMGRFAFVALLCSVSLTALATDKSQRQYLRDFQLQSACKVEAKGGEVSTTAFKPEGWVGAKVPTTVVAAQLAAGQFDGLFERPADDR